MKKFVILLCLLGLFGCATHGENIFGPPTRTVENNIFVSDKNPYLIMKVSDDFEYQGKFDIEYSQAFRDHADTISETAYAFTKGLGYQNELNYVLSIDFRKFNNPNSFWRNECFGHWALKEVSIANKEFCSGWTVLTGDRVFGGFIQYVQEWGATIAPYYIVRTFSLRVSRTTPESLRILYIESIDSKTYYQLRPYLRDKASIVPSQIRNILDDINERAMESLQILD